MYLINQFEKEQDLKNIKSESDELRKILFEMYGLKEPEDFLITKKRPHVEIKQIIYYLLVNKGYSLTRIGIVFNTDHASVSHGVRVISNAIEIYPKHYGWIKEFK